MSLTNSTKFNVIQLVGAVPEVALIEPSIIEAEAVPVTMQDIADSIDFTYSATAEDNGTAGDMDLQPGVIYAGPSGNALRVAIKDFDTVEHAITPPEAADTHALTLWKNSTPVAYGDEGYVVQTGSAIEHNLDTYVQVNEGDVLRVGLSFVGEEADADIDLAPGKITIS
jgi:hypothetical protein